MTQTTQEAETGDLARIFAAERAVIKAARCIRHWHDASTGGMVVSGDAVRDLWGALDALDHLTATQAGKE